MKKLLLYSTPLLSFIVAGCFYNQEAFTQDIYNKYHCGVQGIAPNYPPKCTFKIYYLKDTSDKENTNKSKEKFGNLIYTTKISRNGSIFAEKSDNPFYGYFNYKLKYKVISNNCAQMKIRQIGDNIAPLNEIEMILYFISDTEGVVAFKQVSCDWGIVMNDFLGIFYFDKETGVR